MQHHAATPSIKLLNQKRPVSSVLSLFYGQVSPQNSQSQITSPSSSKSSISEKEQEAQKIQSYENGTEDDISDDEEEETDDVKILYEREKRKGVEVRFRLFCLNDGRQMKQFPRY